MGIERVSEYFGTDSANRTWATVRLERLVDGAYVEDAELHCSVLVVDGDELGAMKQARTLWSRHVRVRSAGIAMTSLGGTA